ncbi:MAG: histone-like nucleoid-structuring protein Lsr2, partial [Blastococcus sp.]
MAKKTTVVLVDDLTGEPADTTVRFCMDSREYELDLTDANAQELRAVFGRYTVAARKVAGRGPGRSAAVATPAF